MLTTNKPYKSKIEREGYYIMSDVLEDVDFNKAFQEQQAEINNILKEIGETIQSTLTINQKEFEIFSNEIEDLIQSFTKKHKKSLNGLKDPITYKSFVKSLTLDDLQKENFSKEYIEDFLILPIEEKMDVIRLLDVFTVCRLYEQKEAEKAFKVTFIDKKQRVLSGYNGEKRIKQDLLRCFAENTTNLTTDSLQWLKPMLTLGKLKTDD